MVGPSTLWTSGTLLSESQTSSLMLDGAMAGTDDSQPPSGWQQEHSALTVSGLVISPNDP